MPTVIQIKRRPNGVETFGQSMQELANNFIQHTLAMTQQQNAQNMQLMGLGMQERRMADANARDDRRWKESTAMQERRFAQEDKWKEQQLALEKQRLGIAYAKDAEERDARKRLNELLNGISSPASGGTGGSIPGLDEAASMAADEVLSPGWSPMSSEGMGGQSGNMLSLPDAVSVRADAPALDLNRRTDQELLEQAGLWPPKPQPTTGELMERAGLWPLKSSHAPTPGSQGDKDATMGLVLNAMKQSLGVPLNQQTEADRVLSGLAPMFGVQPDATPLQAESTPTTGESAPSPSAGPEMPKIPEPAEYISPNGTRWTTANFPPVLRAIKEGKAIYDSLKDQDEMNFKRYEMGMKGFEAAQKTGKADKGEKIKLENTIRYGHETLEAIADAEKLLKRHSRLASGALATNLAPQWNQYHQDLKAHLDTIGGSLLAESVKLLRESSPDGSLGMRLTEKEIFKEIQRFGALTEKASPEVLLKSLNRIRNIYQTVMEDAYNAQVQRGYVDPRSRQGVDGADSDQWEDI